MRSEQLLPMGKVAQIIMGQSPHGDSYNNTGHGFPLLNGPTEFGPTHPQPCTWTSTPTRFCQKGDLLFCVRGSTTGRMNWADKTYCIGRGLCAIRGRENATDTNFLYYTLRNDLPRLLALCAGSVFPNLSRSDFDGFLITWPSEEKRDAIVSLLKTLDDKIELNRRMNETLEAMARAIFKSWFVDFDPVKAKAEGKTLKGLSREIANLFPDSFIDSPLGPIPKGWKAGCLGDIAQNPRRSVQPEDNKRDGVYIGLEHMPQRSIALDSWGEAGQVTSNKFSFRAGEILFGKLRPYFHKVGVAVHNGICSTDILVVCPKSDEWFGFLLGHLSSTEFIDYTTAHSTGTRMPRTNWKDMANYPIVVPMGDGAACFDRIVRPHINKIRTNILESRTLASIRDALLPKLLSGEIRIADADTFIKANEAS
jgi:type I restriction enzyme S subunit